MSEISILNGYKIKDKKAVRYYDTVDDMKSDTTLKSGMYVETKGYYSANDGGNGKYILVNDNELVEDNGSVINLTNGLKAELILENNINVKQFGAKGDGITDDYNNINKALSYSFTHNITIFFPEGNYYISNGLEITKGINLKGVYNKTIITLNSNTQQILLNLKAGSTQSKIENIKFDGVNRLHKCIRIAGNTKINSEPPQFTMPNWKNNFTNCQFVNFDVGLLITTDRDVLDGTTQNFASENMFNHCKFKNNHTHAIFENTQSFNNMFLQTDFENESDIDDITKPMIINRAGGGFTFDTCSIMGGGIMYYIEMPDDSTSLFPQDEVRFNNCRLETYSTHNGNIIYQSEKNVGQAQRHAIFINNMNILQHNTQKINLLNYVGRLYCYIKNLNLFNNSTNNEINIESNTRNYWSGSPYNELTNVEVKNVVGTITYSIGNRTSGNIEFASHFEYKNVNGYKQKLDSANFKDLNGFANISNYGQNYYNNSIKNLNIIQPQTLLQIEDQGFILPKNLMLLKFYTFKQGSRYDAGSDMTIKLYMVKNNSLWVDSSSLDLSTDAIQIAEITAPHHKTGYFETPIVLESNYGNDIRTGNIENYTEGRYYITTSSSNKTAGVIGISYI
jgi:hypothetical protein